MERTVLMIPVTILMWGLVAFLFKLGIPSLGPYTFNAFFFLSGAVICLPIALLKRHSQPRPRSRSFLIPVAAAAVDVGGVLSFLLALEQMPVSVLTPAAHTNAVFTIFLAMVFLKERQSYVQALGTALAIGGVVLLSIPSETVPFAGVTATAIPLMLLVIVQWGAWNFFTRLGMASFGPSRLLLYTLIFSALISLPPFLASSPIVTPGVELIYPIVASAAMVVGNLAFFVTMRRLPLSILVPLVSLAPAVTITLAIVVLGESLTIFQGFGAAVALLGVALLAR